ncbi:MAG: ABC transporter ATP-binding protein [Sphaerochaetaceae bacterium]|jgi:simple sugar transport system ATP-binding protein|nr:ABC transporter ATP-binding protein [Sphaerochaetaceae bacterium]NLV84407.1 ABC transporter ATP-binding protein [Spirochaetales bacterium]
MRDAVEMAGIVKIYGETGLKANDKVDLTLHKGEILCLAGENGAGKTTLMKVLYGMERPDSGTIRIDGKEVSIDTPLTASRLGIGMVHQHFMLIDDFSVEQNVTLGKEPLHYGLKYDAKAACEQVDKVIKNHHFSIEARQKVSSLAIGQKQQVEIVKMLYRDVEILILDEPTAVLTEQETEALFVTLRSLAERGKSLILITHKLHEIKAISNRVAIMRQGKMVGSFKTSEVSEQEIARLIMGQTVSLTVQRSITPQKQSDVMTFRHVSVFNHGRKTPVLDKISFSARSGEILGFAGVGGNGLAELEAVLSGQLPVTSGSVQLRNEDVSRLETAQLRKRGLAYIPADRLHTGCALAADVSENMIIDARDSFSRYQVLQREKIESHVERLLQTYQVKGSTRMPIGTLSGGNIQKVILAREIEQYRDYIVCCEPTWGLDVASSNFVYEQIMHLRSLGAAVLLISSNLDEILALSDRIVVLCRGAVVARLDENAVRQVTKEEMGNYMLGLKCQEKVHGQQA